MSGRIITTTVDAIDGTRMRACKGTVSGVAARSRDIVRERWAFVRRLFGGEVKTYRDLLDEAQAEAMQRLTTAAIVTGANAVLGLRIAIGSTSEGQIEVIVYGTAVVLERAAKVAESNGRTIERSLPL